MHIYFAKQSSYNIMSTLLLRMTFIRKLKVKGPTRPRKQTKNKRCCQTQTALRLTSSRPTFRPIPTHCPGELSWSVRSGWSIIVVDSASACAPAAALLIKRHLEALDPNSLQPLCFYRWPSSSSRLWFDAECSVSPRDSCKSSAPYRHRQALCLPALSVTQSLTRPSYICLFRWKASSIRFSCEGGVSSSMITLLVASDTRAMSAQVQVCLGDMKTEHELAKSTVRCPVCPSLSHERRGKTKCPLA